MTFEVEQGQRGLQATNITKLDNKRAGFLVKLALLMFKGSLFGIPALRGNLFGVSFFFSTMVNVRGSPFGRV